MPSTSAPTGADFPATVSGSTKTVSTSASPAGLAPARDSPGRALARPLVMTTDRVAIASRTWAEKTASALVVSAPRP